MAGRRTGRGYKLSSPASKFFTGVLQVISEREKLEFESLPEFIREPYSAGREAYIPVTSVHSSKRDSKFVSIYENFDPVDVKSSPATNRFPELDNQIDELEHPKNEALDTLWPGVDHDFFQPNRRTPSFYLTIGFIAGAFLSLLGVCGYSCINHAIVVGSFGEGGKKIVVAGGQAATQKAADNGAHTTVVNGTEVLRPVFTSYEVKSGDTLAGIAFKAYKRVSPRMLDEICKANSMRSANVLSLGQQLVLPEYHIQPSQIAASTSMPAM